VSGVKVCSSSCLALHIFSATSPPNDHHTHAVRIAEQIETLKHELTGILGNHSTPVVEAVPAPVKANGRKGKRSAAKVAKMKASQKARWAKVKAPAAPKKNGGTSLAHKAKLAAAAKKRWAKIRAGKAPNPFASKKK